VNREVRREKAGLQLMLPLEYIRVTGWNRDTLRVRPERCHAPRKTIMWKPRKDEEPQRPSSPPTPASPVVPSKEVVPVDVTKQEARHEVAHIGKAVLIKGELSGSEDLYLDGEVEGTIELHQNCLTIGPNARIRAHVNAREVVIHGKVDGDIHGTERVELKRSAVLVGDIQTKRVAVEDGAYFKGSIDVQRAEGKPEAKATASYAGGSAAVATPALVENK
jgi:cytoskeletal protein CcmA (bactofilin family)